MKVIYNNIIPFKGFKCINLFGVLFVRKGLTMNKVDLNHEAIHTAQMKELWYLGFYLVYIVEWVIRLFLSKNAYRSISFEKEAYSYQIYDNYLSCGFRKRFAQWRKNP